MRDPQDLILEVTAALESVKALCLCVASQLDLERLLSDYDNCSEVFLARIQGEDHSERYLELAAEHVRRTRAGIDALIRTSE